MKIANSIFYMILILAGIGIGLFGKFHFFLAQETPLQSQKSLPPSAVATSTNTPLVPAPSIPASALSQASQPSTSTTTQPVPQANPADNTVSQHTKESGGRVDIEQIGPISVSQQQVYTGDDVVFEVTIKNIAPYKKFVRQLCFNSNEGNFGCSPGFNLNPGQVFSISNSGRFMSSGVKNIGITWTQDGENYYSPLNSAAGSVRIL